MADIFDNITLFFQQQIELYGDGYVSAASGAHDIDSESDAASAAWQEALSISELEQLINSCRQCALAPSRTKFVFGDGHAKAEIVFVGEAPGVEEDRQGVPFVGKAGELLTKMLASIQLRRENVYICNILKCRPPQNRDPLPDEIALCKQYLFKQLALIQPRIIVCLGRVSAQVLLETTESLSQLRQRWHSFNNTDLLVTYHPAALLRNPGYKRETWEDLKMLQQRHKSVARVH